MVNRLGLRREVRFRLSFFLRREDFFLRLSLKQLNELVSINRLADQQDLGDALQILPVFVKNVTGCLVGILDYPADLVIYLARDFVGVIGLRAHLAPEERLAAIVSEDPWTKPL